MWKGGLVGRLCSEFGIWGFSVVILIRGWLVLCDSQEYRGHTK
jgi:hypothetical protein